MPPKSTIATLVARLNSCLARCEVILTKLSSPTSTTSPQSTSTSPDPPSPAPSLADIRHDFASWSEFLAKSATELSLALKPPVSLDAAEATAGKMADQLGSLAFCLELLPSGGALTQEIA